MTSHASTTTVNGFRQMLTPLGPSRKRKERDGLDGLTPRPLPITTKVEPRPESKADQPKPQPPLPLPLPLPPMGSKTTPGDNRLLAGYLANEFLTRGSLFGQPAASALRRAAAGVGGNGGGSEEKKPENEMAPREKAYGDVAWMFMGDRGTRVAGVVNPTQLGQWLQSPDTAVVRKL